MSEDLDSQSTDPSEDLRPEDLRAEEIRDEYMILRRARREQPQDSDGCSRMVVDGGVGALLLLGGSVWFFTDGDFNLILAAPWWFWVGFTVPCIMLGGPIGMALGVFARLGWSALREHSRKL